MSTITIAAISGDALVQAVAWLIGGALIYFLCNWAITKANPDQPFRKLLDVLLILIVLVICLNAIFLVLGHPFIKF
jgi:hypothetical protein